MKKIILALMLILPLCASAKEKVDDSKYLRGAVPEVNGVVTFHKSFSVPTMTQTDIYLVIKNFLRKLVDNSIPAPVDYARFNEDTRDLMSVQVCEWQVYRDKFLNLDRSRFRYTLNVSLDESRVNIDMTRLGYYYMEDIEGNNGVTYRAEEWISDKYALNKAGTKLLPKSDKFRRKTIDRAEALFEEIIQLFEVENPLDETAPKKKRRINVVE